MSTGPKIVITGTGRAGTTLLVQVLTDLGLDTGFASDHRLHDGVNAGLELDIQSPGAPRIVKDPRLSRRLGTLLDGGLVDVEHVIVPIRDLDIAVASRVRNAGYGRDLARRAGLFGTGRATQQKEALALLSYELVWSIARHDLPHTFLVFPRFANDWEYTYRKLAFLDPSIGPDRWKDAITARTDSSLIHESTLTQEERMKTVVGTLYSQWVARPGRVAKRMLASRPTRR